MKKACIIFAVIILAGCSAITFNTQEQIALQIVAQRVGYSIAKSNPSIAMQAKLVAQGILASDNSDVAKAAIDMAVKELVKQFPGDPLLESDLKLIVSGLQIDIPNVKIDIGQYKVVVNAFINGLDVGVK